MPGSTQESDESRCVLTYGTCTLCGWLFNTILLTRRFITLIVGPTTPILQAASVWAIPRSLATTSGIVSFPPGTKMFQFPGFLSNHLCVQWKDDADDLRLDAGFPHSDILGSKPAHDSPRLIAVCHVLLQHAMPRHPPYALSSLVRRDTENLTLFYILIRRDIMQSFFG